MRPGDNEILAKLTPRAWRLDSWWENDSDNSTSHTLSVRWTKSGTFRFAHKRRRRPSQAHTEAHRTMSLWNMIFCDGELSDLPCMRVERVSNKQQRLAYSSQVEWSARSSHAMMVAERVVCKNCAIKIADPWTRTLYLRMIYTMEGFPSRVSLTRHADVLCARKSLCSSCMLRFSHVNLRERDYLCDVSWINCDECGTVIYTDRSYMQIFR